MASFQAITQYLRQSLWFLPALFAVGAVVVAGVLMEVDRQLSADAASLPFLFAGGVEGARAVLSVIAQSMLTFTGLVFTVTMLVLQLASSQLSPRVLRTFLRDRANQAVLGLFVATFLYSLLLLRYVRSAADGGEDFVPGISIGVAFALLLASVGAFIYYIDHMAHAIRASTVIQNIAHETRAALEKLFPERIGEAVSDSAGAQSPTGDDGSAIERGLVVPRGAPSGVINAPRAGYVVAIDDHRLLEAVKPDPATPSDDRFIELVPTVGDYVAEDAPLFRLWGSWHDKEQDGLRRAAVLGGERNLEQDLGFGIRQLVDIALRALSSGVNDPTTAGQVLDRLHDILYRLAQRRIPSPVRRDPSGRARLYLGRPEWDDYVFLATEEIRLAGEAHLQVMRRLSHLLSDVMNAAPPPRQAALRQALARVERSVERGLSDPADRQLARAAQDRERGPRPMGS
ncbi:MAG: DUF2254 domain-containing protein [Chloroflexota bacterium]|nr:DUF2254 domain-containing protein [Chloroflexota bacterium]